MDEIMLSRASGSSQREIRFEPDSEEDLAILDGYNAASGESRKSVMCSLLHEWAMKKKHEATLVLRFANSTPGGTESHRNQAG